jgi:hypothetical protein
MKFSELHATIPYAKDGKEKVLRYSPYPNITLAMPGRHAKDTTPPGGDFVVMVNDPVYPVTDHQFTHTDIFKDVELRGETASLISPYFEIIQGADPGRISISNIGVVGAMDAYTFLYAAQCLAVAEHRRYAQYENKFGGRFLPFRFSAGIAEGLWTAADAANLQRRGRPGVEMLEKLHGTPVLTKELMK